ncbi:peptidoglycan recognition protein [Streptomyces sp. NPDC046853]|uniref:peptidoglycan recognition protein family protein n=1 Tax=Streptomyces sp. NPDC046853 TaxID=3154920 RepID=UPI00341054AD
MRVLHAVLGRLPRFATVGLLLMCALFAGPGMAGASGQGGARQPKGHPAGQTRGHPAAKPRIVPRSEWMDGAERGPPARYAKRVKAVFVHHTDTPNDYDCADAPRTIRYLYTGQTESRQWDDIGYNFLVDRCGTIYEGRAGGVGRAVVGAHTQGFNRGSVGIAAIGTFTKGVPVPEAMTDAMAALVAWKLGLTDVDPRSEVRLVSSNSLSRYPKGKSAKFRAVSGHKDGFYTQCPGAALMAALPGIRKEAARLQDR